MRPHSSLRAHVAVLSAILAVLVLSGCTHTRTFNPDWQADRATVNQLAENRAVIVETEDGERFRGTGLRLDPDTVTWVDERTGEARHAPLGTIRSVTVPARGRGAVRGALIGLSIGVVGGYAYASEVAYGPNRGSTIVYGSLAYGLGGVLLGAWIGYGTSWLRLDAQQNTAEAPD